MSKKQAKAVRKIALGTISELDRRGWVRGTLAKLTVRGPDNMRTALRWDTHEEYTFGVPSWIKIDPQEAQVCLVGAASSAYNPFYPEDPGMQYSEHPDYEAFLRAVLSELPKRYQKKAADSEAAYAKRVANGDLEGGEWVEAVTDAIATWNDQESRTLKQVKAVLQKVADKHAPTPAA